MRTRTDLFAPVALGAALAACGGDGASTREMQAAAVERTRAELGLSVQVPLEAKVWTGKTHDDELTYCGTVSSSREGVAVPPQRFVATADPIEFLVFENAHARMVQTGEDKFVSWAALCAGQQAA